jgi:hypothetical protein
MNVKEKIIPVLLLLFAFRVAAQDPQNMKVENQILDCVSIKPTFQNMKEAEESLSNSTFAFTQNFKTTKKSGVKEAHFYSCNHEVGFLRIKVDDKELLYRNVTRYNWKLLIESKDLDEFYEKNIRGRFPSAIRNG